MRFSDHMVPEVFQTFWAAMQRGEFITDAAAEAGTYRKKAAWAAARTGPIGCCQVEPVCFAQSMDRLPRVGREEVVSEPGSRSPRGRRRRWAECCR